MSGPDPDRPILVNVERLQGRMDDAGCAAVVARSGKNFTYLTGVAYPGTLGRHLDFPDTPRDVFCIWPRTGDPVIITHHYSGESDVAFRRGDVIRTDYVSYYRGYPGHQSRLFCLGAPSDDVRRRYRTYHDLYSQIAEYCRPGRRANEVWQLASTRLRDAGFPHQRGAMVGHSVGAWFHQQEPVLVRTEERVIEAGMVIAIEPYSDYWHLQDMFYIGEDGNELLSARFDTRDLFVI